MDKSLFMNIGDDVFISDRANIKRPELVSIGSHVAIDEITVTCGMQIGDYNHIAMYVSVIGGEKGRLITGNFCTIAAGSRIICVSDSFDGSGLVTAPGIPFAYLNRKNGDVVGLMDFASIGTNVVMMPNTWLAEGVVVGANSLVTHPIEDPWTIWVGSPARRVKDRPRTKMYKYARELGYDY